jgi:hypothetical protein
VAQNYTPRLTQRAGPVSKAFSMQTAMFKLADIYLTISAHRQCMHSSCASSTLSAAELRRSTQEGSLRIFAPRLPSFSSMHS